MMKLFTVRYVDSRGPVTAYFQAETAEEIAAAFRDVVVNEVQPGEGADRALEEFGAYRLTDALDGPTEGALRQLRR